MPTVIFKIELPFNIESHLSGYLASCQVLDVHSQGETKERATENLTEALSLFLLSCFERGTLDEVLKDCGFEPVYSKRSKRRRPSRLLEVPLTLSVSKNRLETCHA